MLDKGERCVFIKKIVLNIKLHVEKGAGQRTQRKSMTNYLV